jgi:hypothetical protein
MVVIILLMGEHAGDEARKSRDEEENDTLHRDQIAEYALRVEYGKVFGRRKDEKAKLFRWVRSARYVRAQG